MKTKVPRRAPAAVAKDPIWTDNARAGKEPSVWTLDLPGLSIDVHRYMGIPGTLFGSCVNMNISQYPLNSADVEGAKAEFLRFLQKRAGLWISTLARAIAP